MKGVVQGPVVDSRPARSNPYSVVKVQCYARFKGVNEMADESGPKTPKPYLPSLVIPKTPNLNALLAPGKAMERIMEESNRAARQQAYERSAKHVLDTIVEQIREIEAKLDATQEVAVKLSHFGSVVVMSVQRIRIKEPCFIIFEGLVNDQQACLVQNTSQLSFLIQVVKISPKRQARRIGYDTDRFREGSTSPEESEPASEAPESRPE
jgi:hypothetical protein